MWIKKMKEEQSQKYYIKKYKEFVERVRKMSDEEFKNTEIPDYMYMSNPPFVIIEMTRRGMIKGPVL